MAEVPLVDEVEKKVCRVGAVAEIADLIDDEHVRLQVHGEGLTELAAGGGNGELVNQCGRRAEEGRETVLDGAVGDGNR